MRKFVIGIISVIALLGIIFGIYHIINNEKITSYDEIEYSEYKKLVDNKENFILYIGSTYCSHCQDFKPTIEQFIKDYQIDIKYIDVSKLEDKDYSVLRNKTKVSGTPTVVIFKDGIVESGSNNKIQGAVSYDEIVSFFKEKGFIE